MSCNKGNTIQDSFSPKALNTCTFMHNQLSPQHFMLVNVTQAAVRNIENLLASDFESAADSVLL